METRTSVNYGCHWIPTTSYMSNLGHKSTAKHARRAIARANAILPAREAPPGRRDPRWQAIICVGEFIEAEPDLVCDFALHWAKRRGRDLQSAIYCCLIEHLLEYHCERLLPRIRKAALANKRVAEHFMPYSPFWKFGQAELPENVARLKRLARDLQRHWDKPTAKRSSKPD
jgi:hypothetical protein